MMDWTPCCGCGQFETIEPTYPCPLCGTALFCSPQCYRDRFDDAHRDECVAYESAPLAANVQLAVAAFEALRAAVLADRRLCVALHHRYRVGRLMNDGSGGALVVRVVSAAQLNTLLAHAGEPRAVIMRLAQYAVENVATNNQPHDAFVLVCRDEKGHQARWTIEIPPRPFSLRDGGGRRNEL